MSEETDELTPPRLTGARGLLVVIGGVGLLVALACDAIAVVGRHLGYSVPGSIEAFQMAVAVALPIAILHASLSNHHAAVDLLVGRLSDGGKRRLRAIGSATLALAFGLLCGGAIWVSVDLWPTRETTELLAIPVAPFRLVWIACSALAALHFLRRSWIEARG